MELVVYTNGFMKQHCLGGLRDLICNTDRCGGLKLQYYNFLNLINFLSVFAATSWLMFPAWTLIGVAGSMILLTNIQTANLLERGRGTIVLSLHAMNELSAVVLVLFKVSNYIKYILNYTLRKEGHQILFDSYHRAKGRSWVWAKVFYPFFCVKRLFFAKQYPLGYSFGKCFPSD